jgi:uncharacterized membrane protein YfcA
MLEKYKFKHNFVIASIVGAALVGSINATFRIAGFALCVIGNIYWMWYHKKISKDNEMLWIFVAYFIINSLAIINNYLDGIIAI